MPRFSTLTPKLEVTICDLKLGPTCQSYLTVKLNRPYSVMGRLAWLSLIQQIAKIQLIMFVISNQMVILMNRINDCIRRVPVFLEELICLDLLKPSSRSHHSLGLQHVFPC